MDKYELARLRLEDTDHHEMWYLAHSFLVHLYEVYPEKYEEDLEVYCEQES